MKGAPPGARGLDMFHVGSSWPLRCPTANRGFCASKKPKVVSFIPSTYRILCSKILSKDDMFDFEVKMRPSKPIPKVEYSTFEPGSLGIVVLERPC
jgi:hypothetical protein